MSIDSSNAFMTEETIRKLLVTEEEHPDILISRHYRDPLSHRLFQEAVCLLRAGVFGKAPGDGYGFP